MVCSLNTMRFFCMFKMQDTLCACVHGCVCACVRRVSWVGQEPQRPHKAAQRRPGSVIFSDESKRLIQSVCYWVLTLLLSAVFDTMAPLEPAAAPVGWRNPPHTHINTYTLSLQRLIYRKMQSIRFCMSTLFSCTDHLRSLVCLFFRGLWRKWLNW